MPIILDDQTAGDIRLAIIRAKSEIERSIVDIPDDRLSLSEIADRALSKGTVRRLDDALEKLQPDK